MTGGFLDYYLQHVWPKFDAVVKYLDEINANPLQLKDQELTSYRTYKQELLKNEQIDLYQIMSALEFFRTRILKLPSERRKTFENTLSSARDSWSDALGMFPMFFYRKADKHLNTSYKLEDVEKQLKGPAVAPDSLLYDFVKLIGISPNDFVT